MQCVLQVCFLHSVRACELYRLFDDRVVYRVRNKATRLVLNTLEQEGYCSQEELKKDKEKFDELSGKVMVFVRKNARLFVDYYCEA